jgi:uncharacterized cupin superfamily protein
MSAVPCASSYPASAKLCEEKTMTYTAVPATDKDGKMTLTVAVVNTVPKGEEALKLMNDKTAVSGKGWISWANADQTQGESAMFTMTNGAAAADAANSGLWKCAASVGDMKALADDKAWESCAKGKCLADMQKVLAAKPYLCAEDKESKSVWGSAGYSADAEKKTSTFTAVANGSADGKTAGTINMTEPKYSMMMGAYACTKDCKKVVMGGHSGWFAVEITAGASALVAAASVATVAALL